MSWTIAIIVLSVWILGVVMPYTLHGHIHLLVALAAAIVMVPVLVRAMQRGN
jgi:hypothetical protein